MWVFKNKKYWESLNRYENLDALWWIVLFAFLSLSPLWARMLHQSFREVKSLGTSSSLLDMFPHSEWTRGSFCLVAVASSVLTDETVNQEININEIISFNTLLRSASSVSLETTQLSSGREVDGLYRICVKSTLEFVLHLSSSSYSFCFRNGAVVLYVLLAWEIEICLSINRFSFLFVFD